jgi:hypothetical protein
MKTQELAVYSVPALIAAAFALYVSTTQFPGGSRNPASEPAQGALRHGLGGWLPADENATLWNRYCVGTADSADVPKPNYADPEVQAAVEKLKLGAEKSYYMYWEILNAYNLKRNKAWVPQAELPAGVSLPANAYLVYLCGEFRDRATMIQAKLKWISNIAKLSVKPQQPIDPSKNLWPQVSAHSYRPFLSFSASLWNARKAETGSNTIKLGIHQVDAAVDGMTVCETKYIFSQYIAQNRSFDSLPDFRKGFNTWGDPAAGNCLASEHEEYYDFRGDTNFKPNSPEGNGMIWRAKHMAKYCTDTRHSRDQAKVTDAECEEYFRKPFTARWTAARAGLAAWLFYEKSEEPVFSHTKRLMVVYPHKDAETRPYSYAYSLNATPKVDLQLAKWTELNASTASEPAYSRADLGFNEIMGLGAGAAPDHGLAYERIKNAVDRHTDWYASGYDDGRGSTATEAYSPFVASSYEMSQSDQFTSCGVTIPCTSDHDDRKHWMLIFRIKRADWYTTQRLANGEPIDLGRMWFDETSFGTTHLAKHEHAWDRLGTAMESEYDSIVYLHNITKGHVISDDGVAGNP